MTLNHHLTKSLKQLRLSGLGGTLEIRLQEAASSSRARKKLEAIKPGCTLPRQRKTKKRNV